MRELPHAAADDLLKIVMRRYERASTLRTTNRLGAHEKLTTSAQIELTTSKTDRATRQRCGRGRMDLKV